MNEPISFADNQLLTDHGNFPAKLTVLMSNPQTEMLLKVQWPDKEKAYLLPQQRDKLDSDIQTYSTTCNNDYCDL